MFSIKGGNAVEFAVCKPLASRKQVKATERRGGRTGQVPVGGRTSICRGWRLALQSFGDRKAVSGMQAGQNM